MARKLEVVTVNTPEGAQIFVVRRAKLARPEAAKQPTFLCLHCEKYTCKPWFEVRQDGFFEDAYQLVCYCIDCLQLSIYEFKVKVEENDENHV